MTYFMGLLYTGKSNDSTAHKVEADCLLSMNAKTKLMKYTHWANIDTSSFGVANAYYTMHADETALHDK